MERGFRKNFVKEFINKLSGIAFDKFFNFFNKKKNIFGSFKKLIFLISNLEFFSQNNFSKINKNFY